MADSSFSSFSIGEDEPRTGCRARERTLTRLLIRSEVRKLLVLVPKAATFLDVEGISTDLEVVEAVEEADDVRPRLTILRLLENLEDDLVDGITASVDGTALSRVTAGVEVTASAAAEELLPRPL